MICFCSIVATKTSNPASSMISTPKNPQAPKLYMGLVVLPKFECLRVESTLHSMRPFTTWNVSLLFFSSLFQHCAHTNQGNLSLSPMKQFCSYPGPSRTHLLPQINFQGVSTTLNGTFPKKTSSEYSFLYLITHVFGLLSSFFPTLLWKTILFSRNISNKMSMWFFLVTFVEIHGMDFFQFT